MVLKRKFKEIILFKDKGNDFHEQLYRDNTKILRNIQSDVNLKPLPEYNEFYMNFQNRIFASKFMFNE